MSIESNKLMNLADGKVLYDDLRGRIESPLTAKITTPAAIQSFSDGAEWGMNLKAAVDPVQDLHGFAYPWVGGAGKNLYYCLRAARTHKGVIFTNTDGEISVSGGVSGTDPAYYGSNGGAAESNCQLFKAGTYTISGSIDNVTLTARDLTSSLASCEGTGGSASFTLNEETYIWVQVTVAVGTSFTGTVKLYIQIESGNTATSFAPYSNICPITGWTGAQVWAAGKNLVPHIENGSVGEYGEDSTYSPGLRLRSGWFRVKGNTKYTFNATSESYTPSVTIREFKGYNTGDTAIISSSWQTLPYTLTTNENTNWIRFALRGNSSNPSITPADFSIVQVEEGESATSIVPYSTTYPISFGSAGTVYGGELTVNADGTVTLVVDTIKRTITGTDIASAGSYPDLAGYYFARTGDNTNIHDIVGCDSFRTIHETLTEKIPSVYTTNTRIYFYSDLYTSKEEAVSYFNSNPVNILIELATPIVYSLSVPQVLSILGLNNVWADTGNIEELEYVRRQDLGFIREDTAGQIRAAVDPVQTELDDTQAAMAIVVDGDTAPKNITSGQYVFVKNHSTLASGMYHATAAISSGGSVTSSNVSADANGVANALNSKLTGIFTRKQRTYTDVTIPNTGYIKVDSYSDMSVSTTKYLVSITVRGWSGDIGGVGFAKSSLGIDIYITGASGKTITSITAEYVFCDF